MEKSTNTSNMNTNADVNQNKQAFGETKGEILIEKTNIKGTKFQLINSKDRGYSIGLAGQRITGWYESEANALQHNQIDEINWDFVMGVLLVLMENTLTMKKLEDRKEVEEQIRKGIEIADQLTKSQI